MTPTQLYLRAIALWGEESRKSVAVEELAELILALQHAKRNKNTPLDVIEEIADVYIMCDQLSLIYGVDLVRSQKIMKLHRLYSMVIYDSKWYRRSWKFVKSLFS